MKKILILFILSFNYLCFGIINLTEAETEYLKEKKELNILISDINQPYEFIGETGKFEGINVEIYKKIAKQFDVKINFHSKYDVTVKYDILSNFKELGENFYQTDPLYTLKFSTYSRSKTIDPNLIDDIYIFQGDFIINQLKKLYPNATIQVNDDLKDAINNFLSDRLSILIIDKYYTLQFENSSINVDEVYYSFDNSFNFDFQILIPKEMPLVYSIISKGIYNLNEKNEISKIFEEWKKKPIQKQIGVTVKIAYFIIIQIVLLLSLISLIVYLKSLKKINKIIPKKVVTNTYPDNQNTQSKDVETAFVQNFNSIDLSIDLNGNIIFVGQNVQTLLGYSVDYLHGRSAKILFKENLNMILNIFKNKSSVNDVDFGEVEILSKTGISRVFIYNSQLVKYQQDKFAINCLLQDITERKRLEKRLEAYTNHLEYIVDQRTQKLKESEERFKLLVENSLDGIFLLDNENIVYVNDSFCTLTGHSENELYHNKSNFFDLVVLSSRKTALEIILRTPLSSTKYKYFESKVKNKSGKILDVEINVTNAIHNKKKVVLGLMRDITKKKLAEHEKLERERLLVISQLAVTANDKINSPLNAISGYIEILKMKIDLDDPLLYNAVNTIEKSIKIIEIIMKKLKSMTNITLQEYNLKDIMMFNLDQEIESALKNAEEIENGGENE